jgi:transcriptional regulator with XRE-family HTH domain
MGRENPHRLPVILGQNLYIQRWQRQWTQEEAAKFTGYTVREIQRLEAGTRNVRLVTLAKLAKAWGIGHAWKLLKPPKMTFRRKVGRPRGGKWDRVEVTPDGEPYVTRPAPKPRRRRA